MRSAVEETGAGRASRCFAEPLERIVLRRCRRDARHSIATASKKDQHEPRDEHHVARRSWRNCCRTQAGCACQPATARLEAIQRSREGSEWPIFSSASRCIRMRARGRCSKDRIKPDGIDLLVTNAHPSEIFWRQLHFGEFDISEMSMSSLLILLASGNRDWVALPVFTTRRFFHTGMWARNDSGIEVAERPARQARRRAGISADRGALGARRAAARVRRRRRREIEWWMERTEDVQPWRRHRLQAAAGRDAPPHPAG